MVDVITKSHPYNYGIIQVFVNGKFYKNISKSISDSYLNWLKAQLFHDPMFIYK